LKGVVAEGKSYGVVPESVQKWKKGLTADESAAISKWKGSAHEIRNAIASNPPPPPTGTSEWEARARNLYNAISKAPKVDGELWRGLHDNLIYNFKVQDLFNIIKGVGVGGTWSDPAPMCTTPHKSTALDFSENMFMFHIVNAKTARSIKWEDGFEDEHEATAMPGTKYRILEIKENVAVKGYNQKLYVKMEEI
jgi:hypothetical protein